MKLRCMGPVFLLLASLCSLKAQSHLRGNCAVPQSDFILFGVARAALPAQLSVKFWLGKDLRPARMRVKVLSSMSSAAQPFIVDLLRAYVKTNMSFVSTCSGRHLELRFLFRFEGDPGVFRPAKVSSQGSDVFTVIASPLLPSID